jgi:hypothetical protein
MLTLISIFVMLLLEYGWTVCGVDHRNMVNSLDSSSTAPAYDDINRIFCKGDIVNHIRIVDLEDAAGIRLPFGRTYLAREFSLALYYYDSDLMRNQFRVRSGYLTRNHTYSHHRLRHVCRELSVHALLIGAELASPESTEVKLMHEHTPFPICEWNFAFPMQLAAGSYEFLSWTNAINEFHEPTAAEVNVTKNDRHNSGVSVCLSGLGSVDFFDYHPLSTTNFTGHVIVNTDTYRGYYLMMNQTSYRRFPDAASVKAWGFDPDKALRCGPTFFSEVTELHPSLDPANINQYTQPPAPFPFPSTALNIGVYLLFRGGPFNESRVFDLPRSIQILNPTNWQPRASNHFCRDMGNASSVSKGRWVFRKECAFINVHTGVWEETKFRNTVAPGESCRQTEPLESDAMPDRLDGYVWVPWDCNLVELSSRQLLVSPGAEKNISSSTFTEIWNSMEKSGNSGMLRFTTAANEYTNGGIFAGAVPKLDGSSPLIVQPSLGTSLAFCLKSAGVGLIAGFGDSLGQEVRDGTQNLFGMYGKNHWTDEGHRMTCFGNSSHPMHAIDHPTMLTECIEEEVRRVLHNDTTRQISLIDNYPNSPKVPVKTVILVTNFMVQHATSGHYLLMCERALREIAILHENLAARLKAVYNISYQRIFMSGVAIHGFKKAGLTNARQEWFNRMARRLLTNFEFWDVFNITLPRPDASLDGTHYPQGVSYGLTDTLAHKLCAVNN